MDYLKTGTELLQSIPVLKGLGVVTAPEKVSLVVQHAKGRRRVELETSKQGLDTRLPSPPKVPPPLFLKQVSTPYWSQSLPEHNALYVQLNQLMSSWDVTLPDFGIRLREEIAKTQPRNLIIDLRHNGGGTTALYREFLRTVVAFSAAPHTKVYVLIGRGTYSAAANLVTDLERLADPVFAGEATSECCAFYGDATTLTLPYSGIRGGLTAVKWNLSHNSFDGRREMSPDLPVQLTAKDYFEGRDPVMEIVLKAIAAPA